MSDRQQSRKLEKLTKRENPRRNERLDEITGQRNPSPDQYVEVFLEQQGQDLLHSCCFCRGQHSLSIKPVLSPAILVSTVVTLRSFWYSLIHPSLWTILHSLWLKLVNSDIYPLLVIEKSFWIFTTKIEDVHWLFSTQQHQQSPNPISSLMLLQQILERQVVFLFPGNMWAWPVTF